MELGCGEAGAVLAVLDELDAVWDKLASLPVHRLDAEDAAVVLDRLEVQRRRQPVVEHAVLTHWQSVASPMDMGARTWRAVLGERLGISRGDATRRVAEAAALGSRRTVSGEPLAPTLPATAAAQARGEIGGEHVRVIRDFMRHLSPAVDPGTAEAAEAQLAGLAGGLTPDGLRAVARQLLGYLDPDGTLDDREHARRRGVSVGAQGLDGMSRISGWLDPRLRAALEVILARLAAPGVCNPADEVPCVAGTPSSDQIARDFRSAAQRTHDALAHVCAAMLDSKQLGRQHGLPVSIVATTTLAELTAGAGVVRTGGGTRLPISTLIRMAGKVHPYLLLFDEHRKMRLYYGRSRRTASAAQWLALIATDRGCTKPACTVCGYYCQIHHATLDWQHGGNTDIDNLALACPTDNRLVDDTPGSMNKPGWTTRKRKRDNRTEWIPPPHLDRGQDRINHHHHPEELLRPGV